MSTTTTTTITKATIITITTTAGGITTTWQSVAWKPCHPSIGITFHLMLHTLRFNVRFGPLPSGVALMGRWFWLSLRTVLEASRTDLRSYMTGLGAPMARHSWKHPEWPCHLWRMPYPREIVASRRNWDHKWLKQNPHDLQGACLFNPP